MAKCSSRQLGHDYWHGSTAAIELLNINTLTREKSLHDQYVAKQQWIKNRPGLWFESTGLKPEIMIICYYHKRKPFLVGSISCI